MHHFSHEIAHQQLSERLGHRSEPPPVVGEHRLRRRTARTLRRLADGLDHAN